MTRVEIEEKIEHVEYEIMYEECADRRYDMARVWALEKELKELKAELAKMQA